MKLRNKKTGAIYSIEDIDLGNNQDGIWLGLTRYNSLAGLNEEWEDYEEQKEWYWFIEDNGVIQRSCHYVDLHPTLDKARKDIGNYFESEEEAEKAVEKLKAWKRLKDKGFKFVDFNRVNDCASLIRATFDEGWSEIYDDLDLLFGGEE